MVDIRCRRIAMVYMSTKGRDIVVLVSEGGGTVAARMGFDRFVAEKGAGLWQSAWYLTGDAHRAEDLVQTALARVYSRYDGVATDEQFEAYVRTTMYRVHCSWWHRRWNGEHPTEHLPEGAVEAPSADIDLRRALAVLPRMQRAVLVLRFFEDRSVEDVASMLGISTGTVKTHTSRGCAALRTSQFLTQEEDRHERIA
jgi:RNA polymerase sigma-70 factor (sigma-E family)